MLAEFPITLETFLRRRWERPPVFSPDHILLASFPKSGNTWMRFILSNISRQLGKHSPQVTFHTIARYAPEIRQNRQLKGSIATGSFPLFLKTHFPRVPGFHRYRSLLIVRDPADVMVSLHAHLTGEGIIPLKTSIRSLIKHWRRGMPAWVHFHKSWLGAETTLLKYEDLLSSPQTAVQSALASLGSPVPAEVVDRAIELSTKNRMRKLLAEHGDPHRKNANFQFVRKGVSGEGKKQLPPEDLAHIYNTTPLWIASRLGYRPEPPKSDTR